MGSFFFGFTARQSENNVAVVKECVNEEIYYGADPAESYLFTVGKF